MGVNTVINPNQSQRRQNMSVINAGGVQGSGAIPSNMSISADQQLRGEVGGMNGSHLSQMGIGGSHNYNQ